MSLSTTTCSDGSAQPFSSLQQIPTRNTRDWGTQRWAHRYAWLSRKRRMLAKLREDEQQQSIMLESHAAAGWGVAVT